MRLVRPYVLLLLGGTLLSAPTPADAARRTPLKQSTLVKKVRRAVHLRGLPVSRWYHTFSEPKKGSSIKRFTSRPTLRTERDKAEVSGTINMKTGKVKITEVKDKVPRTGKDSTLDAFWGGTKPKKTRKRKVDALDAFWG
ncbi:MAG: hypothetical protein JRH20_28155 [Deltaproteobacteria bacterium]|nr:hypothetical protein [Deltaproteobacteria bacterium]